MNAIDTSATSETKSQKLCALEAAASAAIKGKRGAPSKRLWIQNRVQAIRTLLRSEPTVGQWDYTIQSYRPIDRTQPHLDSMRLKALGLARMASVLFDEHGYQRGDYLSTGAIDYVPRAQAQAAPCFDLGGAGLGLVEVNRKRVYAKSSKWRPAMTATRYLVGRNESGTFFAHAVPSKVRSVREALDWIWSGNADRVVRRQGDVAVIRGSGPKMPAELPAGHVVDGEWLRHATHPAIRVPGKGERLIVGRRAHVRVSEETRD